MARQTQANRVLEVLRTEEEVPAYVFPMKMGILQYGVAIKKLRGLGYIIKCVEKGWHNGSRHTAFKLTGEPA